ncbi:DUF4276 family protein [candidate division KSB1 bacterium]|nr:DUF4276 family protein [candidate division KSB1 bacterium]
MKLPVLVPIVEGHSEVEAVPILLRRLLFERGRYEVKIARPLRVGRYKVVRSGELERAIDLARHRPEGCAAILLLLDADDDCPKELAPILLARAQNASAGLPIVVVLAKAEIEAWFLGSLESLRGARGLADTAVSPERPEEIRDAKGYLTRQMTAKRTYVEVDDQPAFAEKFDLQLARQRCPSFDKFVRDVEVLLAHL